MIKSNPFTSKLFVDTWSSHFNKNKLQYKFNFIEGVRFFKHNRFPIYINMGRNLTKGISYSLNLNDTVNDYKNGVFLLYDVPNYTNLESNIQHKSLKQSKIKQYPGFLIDLEKHEDFPSYFKSTFSKSSVQKFRRYKRRLELCFSITYKVYHGAIDKEEYDFIFSYFNKLLNKRFDDKQITNNNLESKEWNFYYDVVYPLILEKKASLFVIYNNDTPIAIRLNYYSEDIIFDAITVFDIDYNKFHLGKISNMKMLEWSFESGYKTFDFSKGYFDYKESWSDKKYNFEYHLLYDSGSVLSIILANAISFAFKAKQYLRDRKINEKLHRITYSLKRKSKESTVINDVKDDDIIYKQDMLTEVSLNDDLAYLKKPVFDFLFITSEHLKDLKIYQVKDNDQLLFLLKGINNSKTLSVN